MWQTILPVALGGFLAGVAFADFKVTWEQRHHISTDAIFYCVMSIILFGGAAITTHLH